MTMWTNDELSKVGTAEELQIASLDADHSIEDQIDAAYRTRYRRYARSITDSVTSPGARSTTTKLVPRSSGS